MGKTCSNISCENKIRQFFKKQRRDENIEKGRELVEKEDGLEYEMKEVLAPDNLKRVAEKFNLQMKRYVWSWI